MSVPAFEQIYTDADRLRAQHLLWKWGLIVGGAELALLAIYIVGIVQGKRWLMLTSLLTGFVAALFLGELCLLPALRYRRFLREMDRGLRRSLCCTVAGLSEACVMQDGARVRVLEVHLKGDGDSRIFYLHAERASCIPGPGAEIELESFGRHVTGVRCCNES